MWRWIAVVMVAVSATTILVAQDASPDAARSVAARTPAVYPDLARRLGLEGVVKLRVTVAPDGMPKSMDVLGGNPVLAKSAQDAVSHWRWASSSHETKEVVELRFHNH